MLSIQQVEKSLPPSLKSAVTQRLVDQINNIATDPLVAEQGMTFKTLDTLTDPFNHMILQVLTSHIYFHLFGQLVSSVVFLAQFLTVT